MALNKFIVIFLISILSCFVELKSIESLQKMERNVQSSNSKSMEEKPNSYNRDRRSYYPWESPVVFSQKYEGLTQWKPASTYTLTRPYLIPVYGAKGRIPLYFPPQPILINPGYPMDNPAYPRQTGSNEVPHIYKGPAYLPPDRPKKNQTMIIDKFGEDNDYPIWGNSVEEDETPLTRPPTTSRPKTTRPTRLPNSKKQKTFPPLVHSTVPSINMNPLSVADDTVQSMAPQRPKESRPPQREPVAPPPTEIDTNNPSNCVWGILNCCSLGSSSVVQSCFEQRGCPGPFWDKSPCDPDYSQAAIDAALKYYTSK